jgi:hypothetical protein
MMTGPANGSTPPPAELPALARHSGSPGSENAPAPPSRGSNQHQVLPVL